MVIGFNAFKMFNWSVRRYTLFFIKFPVALQQVKRKQYYPKSGTIFLKCTLWTLISLKKVTAIEFFLDYINYLMEINWKQLRAKLIQLNANIHLSWYFEFIEVINSYIQFIFTFKQYKNANIVNFVYYGKTRTWHLVLYFPPFNVHILDI